MTLTSPFTNLEDLFDVISSVAAVVLLLGNPEILLLGSVGDAALDGGSLGRLGRRRRRTAAAPADPSLPREWTSHLFQNSGCQLNWLKNRLKNRLRSKFDFVTCLNYPFF